MLFVIKSSCTIYKERKKRKRKRRRKKKKKDYRPGGTSASSPKRLNR